MSFSEELKAARLASGVTQQEIAEVLGVDKSTYSGYETGRRYPDLQRLRQLAEFFSTSVDRLLGLSSSSQLSSTELYKLKKYRMLDIHGRELVDMVLDKEYERMSRKHLTEREHSGSITYISCYDLAVSAGTGEPWSDPDYKTRLEIPSERVPKNAHYCARVSGSSMEPAYTDGDIVFVERLEDFVKEGEIGIFFLNGEGYMKRLGADELISLNPDYAPIPLHEHDDFRCQGRVLGKV